MDWEFLGSIILIVATAFTIRLISILPFCKLPSKDENRKNGLIHAKEKHDAQKPLQLFVFLGSGGHTGEMIRLVDNYNEFLLREGNTIHVGYSDRQSLLKFQTLMTTYDCKNIKYYEFMKAREVGSGLLSSLMSIFSTLATSLKHILVIKLNMLFKPHLVLLNGPGTCCIIAVWFKLIDLLFLFTSSNIVYVESLARISTLSLTGKILYWLADEFIVQWEDLKRTKVPRAKFYGILV